MQTSAILLITIFGAALAFPWPWKGNGNSGQGNSGSNWPSVDFSFSLKFVHLNRFYNHIIKSYVDPNILTTYFQLPQAEQQCIQNFFDQLQNNSTDFTNQTYTNQTEDQIVSQLKDSCPGSDAQIDSLRQLIKAEIINYGQMYQNFSNSLPQSIKTAEQNLIQALTFLFQNNEYKNQTALKQVLLPALQSFQQITPTDVQTLATTYPLLAPILTGAQSQAIPTLIQAGIDMINNGTVSNKDQVRQALQTLGQFLKNLLKQILNNIDHAQEAQLPSNVSQALKQKIANDLAKSFKQLAQIPFLKVNIDQYDDVYEIAY